MLELPSVTLVAINTVAHELSDMAVAECTSRANFGDIKVFTNRHGVQNGIYIEPFNDLVHAGQFTTYDLPNYIKTKHVLFIHWDSWIIDPSMWRPQFLDYDYIGPPWWYTDGMNVGNSGFTIRSKALMEFFAKNEKTFPMMMPEDHAVCRHYRPKLEEHGFKWAPETLAMDFAFERTRPYIDSKHFGYHGMFNWPFVMGTAQLAERMAIARRDPYILKTGMIDELDRLASVYWVKA